MRAFPFLLCEQADFYAARVTMWYGFLTAVGSFRFLRLATRFYRIGAHRRLPTFNQTRETLREWPVDSLQVDVQFAGTAFRQRDGLLANHSQD